MTVDILLFAVLALVGLALSALFSGTETGLYTINRVRLTIRSNQGDPCARRLRALIDRPERMLATILIGNNIANYIGSYGLSAILDRMQIAPITLIIINVCILTPLLFVFGEILPKDLFRTFTDTWSYALSRFLTTCRYLFLFTGLTPVVQTFGRLVGRLLGAPSELPTTGRQRVVQLMQEGFGAGVLTEVQTTLVDRSLAFRKMTVGTEMVPWARVVTLPANASQEQRETMMRKRDFSRIPLMSTSGDVVGVLPLLDALLKPGVSTEELAQPTLTFEPDTPIRDALRQMRHERIAMGIIEHPRTRRKLGIVTLKDLVEPLTGELAVW
ncbi:MAG: CNNM domain-containing protein [Planctomycetota bacterium]